MPPAACSSVPRNAGAGSGKTMRAALSRVGLAIWLVLAVTWSHAQQSQAPEYQLKAAFLFNFAKFVDWPPEVFPDPQSPIVIGIVGENPFKDYLETAIRGKAINNRAVVLKVFTANLEITNCHILFVSSSEKSHLTELFRTLATAPVLTVSEVDGFTGAGGMINFFSDEKKVRFEINNESATRARLKISSKLLALGGHPAR